MSDEQLPAIEELDFERSSVERLYRTGPSGINPERWERARKDIRFDDVVAELTGHRDSVIHCPFHGRDAHPSFTIYNRTNDAYCFGCPSGSMYYDSIIFTAKYLEINRARALQWLEQKWDLPPLADVSTEPTDEDESELGELLRFRDLAEHYIIKANRDVQEVKDVELAEDYIRIYFKGLAMEKAAEEAEKGEEGEDLADGHLKAALMLAKVLGKEKLASIVEQKGG